MSILLIALLATTTSARSKEILFTASTPADQHVRVFLGISTKDSIDFIRWQLTLLDNRFSIQCNFGIGKPNTNGFINGGKQISFDGAWSKVKNLITLSYEDRILKLIELNKSLMHILDAGDKLMLGNGGWSYTLNNPAATSTSQVSLKPEPIQFLDSMVFDGRTPCAVPGIIPAGMDCYKLKWRIILYVDRQTQQPAGYRVLGTVRRNETPFGGNWTMSRDNDSRIMIHLLDQQGGMLVHLLAGDENVLFFTDAGGRLLVGNGDFSYTMNRKWQNR